jgi:D-alanyl-D-alanine carboxypeptidase
MLSAVVKVETPAASPTPVATTTPEPAATQPAVVTAANRPEAATPPPAKPNGSAAEVPAQPSASTGPSARTAFAAKPQHRSGWMIQVGAYPAEQAAKQRLSSVQSKAPKMLTGAEAFTEPVEKSGTTFYRARFAGLDKDKAEAACKYLKKNDVECVTIKN